MCSLTVYYTNGSTIDKFYPTDGALKHLSRATKSSRSVAFITF